MNKDIPSLKQALQEFKDQLSLEFTQKRNIISITRQLVTNIDELLVALFHKHKLDQGHHICLVAVGGYGRRELQLHSDIDLLVLHSETVPESCLQRAQRFIQDCWDIGLDVGHQITTVQACAALAGKELSVISSLLDTHVLCGRGALMDELLYAIHPLQMWNSHDYFFAKLQEQNQRYKKYDETAYNLEPNIKYGPGGLRDLQILLTIGKRHFRMNELAEGVNYGFITDKEHSELIHCQQFLMSVRFALHMLAKKREERLLFDYQIKLARLFGYQDSPKSLAIEQFMKAYFKVIKRTRELNDMLLQWFAESILHQQTQQLIPLDESFQLSNQYIEVRNPKVFAKNPQALLTLFLWIAKCPSICGVRAGTVRLIHQHLYLITDAFRQSSAATETFMAIFKTGNNPYEALYRMSQYGVLGHYLACFEAVTGQMQYDLFHVYTVEQHTLFVIRNMSRFNNEEYAKQFPLAVKVMANIPNQEILYLAAFFHDIAKGRGGDHAELGAVEADNFSRRHQLSGHERHLLVWLVENHLLMSQVTQRQDIYDPKTIENFCSLLPESRYIDYLYLLTVADICGTNPALWNAWKDSLLKELYFAAKQAMRQEKILLDETTLINTRRQQALDILTHDNIDQLDVEALWHNFKGPYFLHESPEIIARHTKAILACKQFPLILIMPHHSLGGTEVFIYMPHRDDRFTMTTTVLSNQHATIQEANILTCHNQFDLDTYIILDEQNRAFFDEQHTLTIHKALMAQLTGSHPVPAITKRRLSRTQAHFNVTPKITYSEDHDRQYTCLFLVASDRPGLLAQISRIFLSEKIHLHNAKITTAGERAEDMFYITNDHGKMLSQSEQDVLRDKLMGINV